jgi:hypothetical protein
MGTTEFRTPNMTFGGYGDAEGGWVCILLYVGADRELPFRDWVSSDAGIGVGKAAREPDVAAIFSKPHVYSIGTRQTGDGCGFQGDYAEAACARAELAAFLDRALGLVPELEMFVAWHDFGESGVRPGSFDRIGPADIRTWRTLFRPDEFFVVVRDE